MHASRPPRGDGTHDRGRPRAPVRPDDARPQEDPRPTEMMAEEALTVPVALHEQQRVRGVPQDFALVLREVASAKTAEM